MVKIGWMRDAYGSVINYFFDLENHTVYAADLEEYEKEKVKLSLAMQMAGGPVASLLTILCRDSGMVGNTLTFALFLLFWVIGIATICIFTEKEQKKKETYVREHFEEEKCSEERLSSLLTAGRRYRYGLMGATAVSVLLAAAGVAIMRTDMMTGAVIFLLSSCSAAIWIVMLNPFKLIQIHGLIKKKDGHEKSD